VEAIGIRIVRPSVLLVACQPFGGPRTAISSGRAKLGLDQFDIDEDILEVFRLGPGWLFVCETSLRLVVEHRETARLQYQVVLVEAHLQGDQIIVQEADGRLSRADIDGHAMRLAGR
jgi:hypothetical protein